MNTTPPLWERVYPAISPPWERVYPAIGLPWERVYPAIRPANALLTSHSNRGIKPLPRKNRGSGFTPRLALCGSGFTPRSLTRGSGFTPRFPRPSLITILLATITTAHAQEGLRPIRGPITPGFWEENAVWAIPALIAGGLILALLARWIWKRARAEKSPSPREQYESEAQEIDSLLTAGRTEEVPARLSRVLREYIEASTGVRAPEQTTEEFLAEVLPATSGPPSTGSETPEDNTSGDSSTNPSTPATPFESLRPFLTLTDEAKFAGRALDAEDCRKLLDTANRFVAANEEAERAP